MMIASQYVVAELENEIHDITLDRIKSSAGIVWGIKKGSSSSLSKTSCEYGFFHFHIEPKGSEKGVDFLREYRFETLFDAFMFWEMNRDRIICSREEQEQYYTDFLSKDNV